MMKKNLENAAYVSWEESERGWGTRPDGCSLHLTEEDYRKFVNMYWKGMPNEVPDEYSRPAGSPCEVKVSKRLYDEIRRSKYGLRYFDDNECSLVKKKELVFVGERSGWVAYGGKDEK
mgnify:CR=1 FL=1